MKLRRRQFLHLAAGAAALSAVSRIARAQTYPDRPVKIVVPVAPSGSYDIVGRALADQLSKRLDQTVIVENRPGAGTVVGTQAVIQSQADGYTLLVGGLSNIAFNVGLYNKPPYDPLKDLVPVALVFNISYTLIGNKSSPYASPKEIVAAAKKNPGKLTVANVGVGSGQHIVGAAFMKITGTQLLEVPYRGPALAYPDILSGRVDLFFDSTPSALNYIKSGQVRGIGILTAKRNPQAPDVPTMTESGVPGLEIDFLDRAVRSSRYAAGRDHSSPTGDRAVHARAQAAFRGHRRRTDGGCAGPTQCAHQVRLRPLDRGHP